jgi:cation:H+ antiporter
VSPLLAIPLFIVSLAITLVAARLFARRLDRLGVRLRLPEALIGLLAALAADGPEISAALFALVKGANSVGVGVIVGSNTFNLAAMLGVSGILAGSVWVSRPVLLLEGATGAAITLIAVAVLFGWLDPAISAVLAACVIVPYLVILLRARPRGAARGARANPVGVAEEASSPGARNLPARSAATASSRPRGGLAAQLARVRRPSAEDPTHHLLALILLDVALIVAASAGMVQAAITLGDHWQVSRAVLGMLILAPLTSIPNALTGVRLGLARRSTALVGEAFNSNTINLAAGVIVPSLFVTLGALSATAEAQVAWLVGMTAVTLLMLARRRGMRRADAWVLIALYGGFVVTQLVF